VLRHEDYVKRYGNQLKLDRSSSSLLVVHLLWSEKDLQNETAARKSGKNVECSTLGRVTPSTCRAKFDLSRGQLILAAPSDVSVRIQVLRWYTTAAAN
jgi:hypothetical protein